jgi:hypothetical protein
MGRQQRDRCAEQAAISAAADRLIAGTPLRSPGKLTVSTLITESGLRRDVMYGDHKDQVEAFQAKVKAQNFTSAAMQQLAAQNAGLQNKLTAVKAELAAARETGAVLRWMMAELSPGTAQGSRRTRCGNSVTRCGRYGPLHLPAPYCCHDSAPRPGGGVLRPGRTMPCS